MSDIDNENPEHNPEKPADPWDKMRDAARQMNAERDFEERIRPKINGNGHDQGPLDDHVGFRQTSSEFVADFVPPDYLIEGVLQRRFIYSLTGKTGSGKTSVTLLLSALVGYTGETAQTLGKLGVDPGVVFYFAGENPDDARMRWIALCQQNGFDPAELDVHFFPHRFAFSDELGTIAMEAADVGGVALCIVDTSQAYFEGDDHNSNTQQAEHVSRLRKLTELPGGPTVIINSHPVKRASEDDLIPYGGGAFLNEIDGNLTCNVNGSVVTVSTQGKFRGPEFAPIHFQLSTVTHERLLDSKGRKIPTVVARYLSEAAMEDMSAALAGDQRLVLQYVNDHPGESLTQIAAGIGWTYRTGAPAKTRVHQIVKTLSQKPYLYLEVSGLNKALQITKKGEAELARSDRSTP